MVGQLPFFQGCLPRVFSRHFILALSSEPANALLRTLTSRSVPLSVTCLQMGMGTAKDGESRDTHDLPFVG